MSTELLSPEVEPRLDSQEIEKEKTAKDIEQETECPRCHDVMALSMKYI